MDPNQNRRNGDFETTYFDLLTIKTQLPTGERLTLRPLQPEDSIRFGDYLCGLSEMTRAFYGPHPFNRETADAICASLNHSDVLRMTATLSDSGEERTIAYALLKLGVLAADAQRYERLGRPLNADTDATLAPSVADDFQSKGVGSLVMNHLLHAAGILGRTRIVLWGGVQARNARAIHFYTKWGFHKVGEFYDNELDNYDMILDLP